MPNWHRTPPKSMAVEEIKKRMEAGLKRWRAKGWLPAKNAKVISTVRNGPGLDKQGRKRVIQACELAIYSLANHEAVDYCHAIDVINATRRLAGLSTQFMANMCEGIAEAAAATSGEPFPVLDRLAKLWLVEHFTPSNRVISLPTRGKSSEESEQEKDSGQVRLIEATRQSPRAASAITADRSEKQIKVEPGTDAGVGETPSTRH